MNYKTYEVTIYENGDKYWRNEKGVLHNEHGPAIEYANGNKAYWLNDKSYYNREKWKEEVQKSNVKELTVSQVNELLGFDVKIVKE